MVLTTLFGVLAATAGCTRNPDIEGTNQYRLLWPNSEGRYSLQNVSVETLSDPAMLKGEAAHIFVDPYVSNGTLQSSAPAPRYVRANDVIVPADFNTLQSVALYAHFERLRKVDQDTGAAQFLQWPMSVGVQANVVDESNQAVTNNALYDGRLDALLIVPYIDKKVPISLNAGIIAHEHFHKIFQELVLNRLRDSSERNQRPRSEWLFASQEIVPLNLFSMVAADVTPVDGPRVEDADGIPKKVYNSYLFRGVNEGLADYWGWMYSGDVKFIGHSLPKEEDEARRLDRPVDRLENSLAIRNALLDGSTRDGLMREEERYKRAYRLGTKYARFMRELTLANGADEKNIESRKAVAKALIEALDVIGRASVTTFETEFISPNSILNPLFEKLPTLNQATCLLFDKFAANETATVRPPKCAPFAVMTVDLRNDPAFTSGNAPAVSSGRGVNP